MDVSQYLEIFIDESAEHLQTLSDCIMELEKEPDNKDVINEIFRAAHSLKGMAGTMGFKRMQHLTHDMENVFQEVRSEKIQVDSQMIDLLFKCLDAIDGYLENIKATSDEGEEDNEVIIKELNNFLAKANGEAAAAEAAPAEKEKEAAAPTDNGDHKLYLQIDLTDQERDAVMTAKDSGMHIYGMTVMIQKECLLKAARAFLVQPVLPVLSLPVFLLSFLPSQFLLRVVKNQSVLLQRHLQSRKHSLQRSGSCQSFPVMRHKS